MSLTKTATLIALAVAVIVLLSISERRKMAVLRELATLSLDQQRRIDQLESRKPWRFPWQKDSKPFGCGGSH